MHERMCLLSRGPSKPQNAAVGGKQASAAKPAAAPNYVPGPYFDMKHPVPLGLESDKDWLTPLHCFIRRYCVEVFTATEIDVATPSKGKRKPITVGQVGIRCPHCHHPDAAANGHDAETMEAPERDLLSYMPELHLQRRYEPPPTALARLPSCARAHKRAVRHAQTG